MTEFKISFQKTLTHEGGYSNDPDDQGGETYKGISRTSHSGWLGWSIIDNYKNKSDFPMVLEKDVVLQKDVEIFYWTNFWLPIKAYQIQNQTSADSVFDFAVNAGATTSTRLVQAIVGAKIDGIIGEITLNKINSMDFAHFQAALTVAKMKYYMNRIRKRPTSKKFLLGWISRSLSFND